MDLAYELSTYKPPQKTENPKIPQTDLPIHKWESPSRDWALSSGTKKIGNLELKCEDYMGGFREYLGLGPKYGTCCKARIDSDA